MSIFYEKPVLLNFSTVRQEVGMGICMTGSIYNDSSDCINGYLVESFFCKIGCVAMIGCKVGNAAGGECDTGVGVNTLACPILQQCCTGEVGESSFETCVMGEIATSCSAGPCAVSCISYWNCSVGS